jgi:hypothetical protein
MEFVIRTDSDRDLSEDGGLSEGMDIIIHPPNYYKKLNNSTVPPNKRAR